MGCDEESTEYSTASAPPDAAASITPYLDGPPIVRGDCALCEVDGTPISRSGEAVALSRCGRSAVRPFRDSSHRLAGRT